jgi:hypothetical protein
VGVLAGRVRVVHRERVGARHRCESDLAHEVLVVGVDGDVGEATAGEVAYAEGLGGIPIDEVFA